MKVLIAEDDPVSRRLLQSYLKKWGYEVVTARDGEEALRLFQQAPVPLVISDWMMPGIEGVELVRRIRSFDAADRTPAYVYIILLTAKSSREDVVHGMEAGADDFVSKPFDREELRVRVRAGERIIRLEQTLADQNRLLEVRVRERTTDLARANEALHGEVTERQRTSEALASARDQLLQAEREKKAFYQEIVRAVTHDRLQLVDAEEMRAEGRLELETSLEGPTAYSTFRKQLLDLAHRAGMRRDDAGDLLLAAGEAVTNAIKHAIDPRAAVYLAEDRIIVRVSDRGAGIHPQNLPASVLRAGFSTKRSLGMGYTLMLQLVDRVWLATGPEGTVVQIEKTLQPQERPAAPFEAFLERF